MIIDLQGRVLGRHKGILFYTIGQRRGLELSLGERMYVIDMDPRRNTIVVGPEEALMSSDLVSKENNFIVEELEKPMEVQAQIRYRAKGSPAVIIPLDRDKARIHFYKPQRAITPG